uniref:Syndecan n=1 Tax=Pogona vitticeps TaxID=103695 RepID=A0A6J0SYU1_9SAUR
MVPPARALCVALLCLQAVAAAEPADISLPPEDQDSSGDDYDAFSGSGSLPDHPVAVWDVTSTSLMPELSTAFGDNQPEIQKTEDSTEDHTTVAGSTTTSPSMFHVLGMAPGKPRAPVEEDALDSLSKQGTQPAVVTTGFPVTRHVSTVRLTTSQASSTLKVAEPEVYHNIHHILTPEEKIPASAVVPPSERSPDIISSTTGSSAVQKDLSSPPEGEITQTEESSGDPGDFVFPRHGEKEAELDKTGVGIGVKDEKSAGAPQGIMDRKEVLGGVIAGGLVGLLFAGFLVGFMLYRMKKKDEGSYSLDEPKQSNGGYQKPHKQEEFYA